MEIIRENEIKLDNGHVVKIVTISNKYEYGTRTYEILVDEKDNAITPKVKSIKFDKEHQMFFESQNMLYLHLNQTKRWISHLILRQI